jgi:hypothetical protein
MATCPRCGEFLHEHHRCRGVWRLRLRAWFHVLLGGIIGAGVGWLLFLPFTQRVSWLALGLTACVGVIVAMALQGREP